MTRRATPEHGTSARADGRHRLVARYGYADPLVGTEKRARQKELHKTRLEEARKEAAKRERQQRLVRLASIVVAVLVVAGVMAFLTRDKDDAETSDSTTTAASDDSTNSSDAGEGTPVALTGPGPGASIDGPTPCPATDGTQERTTGFTEAPPMCIDPSKKYTATITTSKGVMVVDLLTDKAPATVNNFVVLSRYKFYDGAPFFRLITDFAAQTGDPSEAPSNAAQFGYTIPDELPAEGDYKVGSLAMANAGPDTGGAQWFIVLGDQGAALPPNYTLFGQVTDGLDTVEAINAVGSSQTDTNDGAPHEQIDITSIEITEG